MKRFWLLFCCLVCSHSALSANKVQAAAAQPRQQTTRIVPKSSARSTNAANTYAQAQRLYQQRQYAAVARLLRDDGGDGSEVAQNSLYLLLQAQQKLKHCQSVIQIGQRFTMRFARHRFAPDALYAVGECQWQMQQHDIARETWQQLRLRYPRTAAAQRAHNRLQSNR